MRVSVQTACLSILKAWPNNSEYECGPTGTRFVKAFKLCSSRKMSMFLQTLEFLHCSRNSTCILSAFRPLKYIDCLLYCTPFWAPFVMVIVYVCVIHIHTHTLSGLDPDLD